MSGAALSQRQTVTCLVCGAPAHPERSLAAWAYSTCRVCGHVFRDGSGIEQVYAQDVYRESYGALYTESDEERRRDARVGLAWLAGRLPASADLLDVGAAGGAFVAEAGELGYRARGIEPTPSFAAHARENLGVDVRTQLFEEVELDDRSLDVVTLWHVLEHLPDPVGDLTRVFGALRPGGIVAIEVPNYASAVARHQGTAWTSLQPEVHISQFTPTSMGEALRHSGFDVVEVFSIPITPYLSPVQRLAPGHIAARLKATRWLGTPRAVHPSGHELLRAMGTVPSHPPLSAGIA